MNDETITCRFVFNSKEVKHATRCFWRYSSLKWWFGGILLILLIGTAYPMIFPDTSSKDLAQNSSFFMNFLQNILPIIIFVGLMVYLFVFQTQRSFKKSIYSDQEMVYTLRISGVHLANALVQSDMKWDVFPKVVENRDGFALILKGARSLTWLPKSGFTSHECVHQCRELFRQNIKDSKRLFSA